MQKSSMDNWFPRVKDLSIKTPDTYRIGLEKSDGDMAVELDEEKAVRAVERLGGPPAFIRTGHASDKHKMGEVSKVPVAKPKVLKVRANKLALSNARKGLPVKNLYVREWLDIAHDFKAFDELPIGYEVRYFIHDGGVVGKHFYWPEEAIRFWNNTEEPDDWKDQLKKSKKNTLRLAKTLDRKIDPVLQEFDDGFWSVDFAFTDDGEWYLIDMARGEVSWHPKKDEVDGSVVTAETYKDLY